MTASEQPQLDGDRARVTNIVSGEVAGDSRVHQAGHISMAQGDLHLHYEDSSGVTRRGVSSSVEIECPYPGLAAFGPQHVRCFSGRLPCWLTCCG
jgi:hypothetical protein